MSRKPYSSDLTDDQWAVLGRARVEWAPARLGPGHDAILPVRQRQRFSSTRSHPTSCCRSGRFTTGPPGGAVRASRTTRQSRCDRSDNGPELAPAWL